MTSTATTLATGFAPDPAVPQRDVLLDQAAMGTELGRALDRSFDSCSLVRAKYRVGQNLRVSFLLRSGPETVRISLRCFPDGSDTVFSRAGSTAAHLPHLAAIAWQFPNDRRLAALKPLLTDDAVRRRALGTTTDALEVVSYAPEKAATVKCSKGRNTVGYAKLFSDDRWRTIADKYGRLHGPLANSGIAAPRLCEVDPKLRLILISEVPGEVLADTGTALHWHRLGTTLARLHSLPLGLAPGILHRFERATLPRLRSAAAFITAARPDVGQAVSALLVKLSSAAASCETGEPDALLHGDVHAKNILINNGNVGLIDLDQMARGPVVAELGSAIAALRYGDHPDSTAWEAALLEGYNQSARLPDRADLAWHTAAALLGERALRAVNRVRLDGLSRLPQVVHLAHRALEGADR